MFFWKMSTWPESLHDHKSRQDRLRDIEQRMTGFIEAKKGLASENVIGSVKTARKQVLREAVTATSIN